MLHYKPSDGYVADTIPFFWDGVYHLFYLKAPLEPKRNSSDFTVYAHISTQDFDPLERAPCPRLLRNPASQTP